MQRTDAPSARSRRSVASWILYDLANTSFSLGIVTLYFPILLHEVLGYQDDVIGTLDAIAAGLVFVLAPILGALSDQAPRRLPFLAVSTGLCVAATFVLGDFGMPVGFVLFVFAVVCFQAGLIFYDSLLPVVSSDENRGRIGGLGVGVGYGGSLVAIGTGALILAGTDRTAGDYATVFRAIALIFLVAALPVFLFVREPRRIVPPVTWRIVPRAFAQLAATAGRARRYRGLGSFLIGRMFYADAANTLIAMVAIYAMGSLSMTSAEAGVVAVPSIVAAIPAGIGWGFVVDRIGPRRTLDGVLLLWMATLATAAAIPVVPLPRETIWIVAIAVGVALGGTWAADRPYMARIAPPRYYGQFFGLYSMVGRFGAIVGPFMWGMIASPNLLGWGQPAAVVFLLAWVAVAFAILRRVDDRPREWGPEDRIEAVPP